MSRFVCQVISNEDIYKSFSNLNFLSNKQDKSVALKYESVTIDEKIAQGGFGTVFKVHSFNKEYALKTICVNNHEKLLNCIQEIFILRNVRNDYILRFVDSIIYQTDSDIFKVFLLTDFYPGNLQAEIKDKHSYNGNFDEGEILSIMTNIAEAVACLHHFLSQPIVHRDLKVENILIGSCPNRYVLCDFGSATLKEVKPCEVNRQELQEEILQFTTLAYRSPEMADLYYDGGEHTIGRKSDIWAMGVLLYNICFFTLPFGDSVLSILSGMFTVPDYHNYSENLMKILNYCLSIDPDQRPDIYQLSELLFSLSAKSNPVSNNERSDIPTFDSLSLPITESESKLVNTNRKQKNNKNLSNQPVSTSINPRNRPKAGVKSTSFAAAKPSSLESKVEDKSPIADLLVFESNSLKAIDDKVEIPRTKSIDEFEIRKTEDPQPDDLMDFKSPVNQKFKQFSQGVKSQSLGANFSSLASGQRFNVYEMISHSYQNVCKPQQFPYQNFPNTMIPSGNHFPLHPNNPFLQSNNSAVVNSALPHNQPNNYHYSSQIGHRRLVSDPSSWYQTPIQNYTIANDASSKILQPQKIPVKHKVTNVLDEFDPLTN